LSRTDVLTEIKKAEAEADAKVAQAEADKKEAIANARRESVKKIQDAEAQMQAAYDSAIAGKQAELQVKRDALLSEGKAVAAELAKVSKSKIPVIEDYLNNEFERTLDVAT
jgi:V/A-type H+/Na+-transporting ATPase subunit G/H